MHRVLPSATHRRDRRYEAVQSGLGDDGSGSATTARLDRTRVRATLEADRGGSNVADAPSCCRLASTIQRRWPATSSRSRMTDSQRHAGSPEAPRTGLAHHVLQRRGNERRRSQNEHAVVSSAGRRAKDRRALMAADWTAAPRPCKILHCACGQRVVACRALGVRSLRLPPACQCPRRPMGDRYGCTLHVI
jgi:hypothetical protein